VKPYYQDEAVTLYHADCRDVLPTLEQVDHVITDMPFSEYTHGNAKSNRGVGHGNAAIDFAAIDFAAIDFILRELGGKCRRWFVGNLDWRHIAQLEQATPEPWEFVRFGVWVKTNPMPQISADRPANGWDGICYLHQKATKKRWNGGGSHGNWIGPVVTNGLHPTGKPEDFIERLITQHTDEGELILDPFAGSGTTGVVAKRMGRRCILIERDEKYCEIAARRLSIRFDTIPNGLFSQQEPEAGYGHEV
jgi:site-specific DNA-methyltransferase (adenine-specific)